MDLDCALMGGLVVDGTGARAYRADVGIRRGRIEAIGDLAGAPAGDRLDARARVVCPGFIDMHSHSDLSLLLCPTGGPPARGRATRARPSQTSRPDAASSPSRPSSRCSRSPRPEPSWSTSS